MRQDIRRLAWERWPLSYVSLLRGGEFIHIVNLLDVVCASIVRIL